jgi:hypothetical protein
MPLTNHRVVGAVGALFGYERRGRGYLLHLVQRQVGPMPWLQERLGRMSIQVSVSVSVSSFNSQISSRADWLGPTSVKLGKANTSAEAKHSANSCPT